MGLPPDSPYLSTDPHALYQVWQIRITAVVCSGMSIMTSLVAFYWFFRMNKLFRHRWVLLFSVPKDLADRTERLIMLLVYGDVIRSGWYFIFAVYSLVLGTVKTESPFCQASGFFIQYGTETSGEC
jgi:hypothetical protein